MVNEEPPRRPLRARLAAIGLWTVLVVVFVVWAALIWHPWIDWFGDPQR